MDIDYVFYFDQVESRSKINMLKYAVLNMFILRHVTNADNRILMVLVADPAKVDTPYLERMFEPITDQIICYKPPVDRYDLYSKMFKKRPCMFINYDVFFLKVPSIESGYNYNLFLHDDRCYYKSGHGEFRHLIQEYKINNNVNTYDMLSHAVYEGLTPDHYLFGRM